MTNRLTVSVTGGVRFYGKYGCLLHLSTVMMFFFCVADYVTLLVDLFHPCGQLDDWILWSSL